MVLQLLFLMLFTAAFCHTVQAMDVPQKQLQLFYENNMQRKVNERYPQWSRIPFKNLAESTRMTLTTILNPQDTTPLLIQAADAAKIDFIKKHYTVYTEICILSLHAKSFVTIPLQITAESLSIENFSIYTSYDIEHMLSYFIKALEKVFRPSPFAPLNHHPNNASSHSQERCCCTIQ